MSQLEQPAEFIFQFFLKVVLAIFRIKKDAYTSLLVNIARHPICL